MSNNLRLKPISGVHPKWATAELLAYATFVAVAILHATPVDAQDASLREQLEGVDLKGVEDLRLSPNGELAAGLTRLYPNPGPRSGSFSLIKIWSVKKKQLVHEFRVPGKAYEIVFSPDGSTVVAADRTGNLGYTTTIRAWNLVEGSEHEVGAFGHVTDKLHFSADGSRLAAITYPDYSWLNLHGDFAFKLKVWRVTGEGDVLNIIIPNAIGDNKATCLPMDEWSNERRQEVLGRVTPVLRGFSADGKQLICDSETGLRTTYDARSGKILQHPNVCSVSLFKSMLMIALNQVPADVKSLTIKITPHEKPILCERGENGLWRMDTDTNNGFEVDDEHFVSVMKGVKMKEHIAMRLGLKDDTNVAELSSFRHPLGVIKIKREETGLKFQLEEVTDGTEPGETLQAGEVRWANPSKR